MHIKKMHPITKICNKMTNTSLKTKTKFVTFCYFILYNIVLCCSVGWLLLSRTELVYFKATLGLSAK